jgi:hypothetical protein
MRWFAVLVSLLVASTSLAITVDPPQRINVQKLDRTPLTGLITEITADDITVMDAQKQTQTIKFEELTPDVVMNLNERLLRKGSGDDWMALGKKLLTMPGGRAPAERAFQKALKADPNLKDQIQALRKEASLNPPPAAKPAPLNGASTAISPTQPAGTDTSAGSSREPKDPSKPIVGPQSVGAVDPSAWGKQTPEQMASAVAKLKEFAADTEKKLNVKLQLYETQYFLFYTDLPQSDAMKWQQLLDKMYTRMADLFAVPKGENLWRGKGLVFVFSREDDYFKFEVKMHATVAAGTAGMCHTFGNGDVHIAFYRQPNDMDFAHVLVHESTHGFLHRYRSPVHIPSWANEGLAEVIASELVPQKGIAMSATAEARNDLQTRKNLGKMFEAEHIVAWQYPVSRTLCEFMIRQSKPGYVDFINGIKDGLSWDEALKQKYGVTVDQLVNAYGISMGVQGLAAE